MPLLNAKSACGKSQAARDVQRICKMGHSELLAEKVELKVLSVINQMISKVQIMPLTT